MIESDLIRAEIRASNAQARAVHLIRSTSIGDNPMIPSIRLQDFNSDAIDTARLNVLTVMVPDPRMKDGFRPYECTRTPPNAWRVICDGRSFIVTGNAGYLELALIQESNRRARISAVA
jgi:hypothetical protein